MQERESNDSLNKVGSPLDAVDGNGSKEKSKQSIDLLEISLDEDDANGGSMAGSGITYKTDTTEL